MSAKELLVVAVEASADLHGAAVIRALREQHPGLRFFGAGGPRMRAEGCETLVRAEDLSVMGFAEVLPALPRIFRALRTLEEAARARGPAAALLIDSPDFNLRLARRLRARGVQVAYFIGPSVWAWRTYRVRQIARDVSKMLVILPFEAAFYERHGVRAVYVGNPLADDRRALPPREDVRGRLGLDRARPVLALLPGSRRQEIARLWPRMLEAARQLRARHPELQLVSPIAPTLPRELLTGPASGMGVVFTEGDAPDVLSACDAAVVASGTATLEAALALAPTVVVYRMSWLSWIVARLVVRLRYVSLVNLLAGRGLVPELLQRRCTPAAIVREVEPLLRDGPEREAQREGLREVRAALLPGGEVRADVRAAAEVAGLLGGSR